MKRGSGTFLTAILLSTAIGTAVAANFTRGPVPFGVIDANKDGVISAQEFDNHRNARQTARAAQGRLMRNAGRAPNFQNLDVDGNGYLTPAELVAGQQTRMASRGAGGRPCWRRW